MAHTLMEADSVLAIDIGAVQTRALLFDVAEGFYHFIAAGTAPTTADAPFKDISEGVRLSIDRLQSITGRVFIGSDERLILPSRPDGSGVDILVSTLSAGPTLNLAVVGLLPDVSLESARRLAGSTYGKLMESIGLNDRRESDLQIDAIIQSSPDIVILAGGTEGGATRSVAKMLEPIGLACYLLPSDRKPTILYAGNSSLEDKVKATMEGIAPVVVAPNVRPAFDLEDLGPAQECLAEVVEHIRARQIGGIQNLITLTGGHSMSSANAFGRIVRFLSRVNNSQKGVLGIDLGASSTVVASAFAGRMALSVHSIGMGASLNNLLHDSQLSQIGQWLPLSIPQSMVLDYLHHKSLYPGSLPVTPEDLAIEQAAARQILRQVTGSLPSPRTIGLPVAAASGPIPYEPILASGSVLARAPTPGQSLMMLLDGIQPVGITTFVLDQNSLASALGAAAEVVPLLPVQVFESGAFLYLGTVVSPVSDARFGAPILNATLVREDSSESVIEVTQGSLHALPLPRGQSGQLILEPVGKTNLALSRPGRGVKIVGGALGVVIDARGRPLNLPADENKRRDLLKKWLWTLGG